MGSRFGGEDDLSSAVGKQKRQHRDINPAELTAVLERAKAGPLVVEDYAMLKAAMDTLVFLQQELKSKGASIQRLRQIVFGSKTEKTDKVLGKSAKAET